MDFNEAYTALFESKKIRRKIWDEGTYLQFDGLMEFKAFSQDFKPFRYDLTILNPEDCWVIVGQSDIKIFNFREIIPEILEGKKVKLKDWNDDTYIILSECKKFLYRREIIEYDFVPTFVCFTSLDWEILP